MKSKNLFEKIKEFADQVGKGIDYLGNKFDSEDPIIISPYLGYANDKVFFFKGRVLENEMLYDTNTEGSSKIKNFINNFKRFETDEKAGVNVRIDFAGQSFETLTDHEGYFTLYQEWDKPLQNTAKQYLPVDVELISGIENVSEKIKAQGEVYIPSSNADYGIITDVDDTVLQTHVTSFLKLKMLYHTFLKNARERKPMEGMVDLFQSFVKGGNGNRQNPIFYLSHSPWNIYDLLEEFLETQDFPKGPILLRDYGIKPSGAFAHHKTESIIQILNTYPDLPFVLLGDTADYDADFYIDIAKRFPDRIKAIYIRQTKDTKNARRIYELIKSEIEVNALLIHHSDEIYQHALQDGIIKEN